jgi:hypothetical protein
MLAFALIAWQVLGLPEVLAGVLSLITRPSSRDRFVGIGTLAGLCFGIGFYALSLIAQLVFGP